VTVDLSDIDLLTTNMLPVSMTNENLHELRADGHRDAGPVAEPMSS